MAQHSRTEIVSTIQRLLIAELEVSPVLLEGSTADTPLLGRGVGLDSVEALALALGLEREFDISIPDADLTVELFESLGALADYVARQAAEQHAT
jgi:acyl carrier protein